jgi:hypothetical protein
MQAQQGYIRRSQSQPGREGSSTPPDQPLDSDRRQFVSSNPLNPPSWPQVCDFCKKEGRVRCSICKQWYCSQQCQINDWPNHRQQCLPPPPLEKIDG